MSWFEEFLRVAFTVDGTRMTFFATEDEEKQEDEEPMIMDSAPEEVTA